MQLLSVFSPLLLEWSLTNWSGQNMYTFLLFGYQVSSRETISPFYWRSALFSVTYVPYCGYTLRDFKKREICHWKPYGFGCCCVQLGCMHPSPLSVRTPELWLDNWSTVLGAGNLLPVDNQLWCWFPAFVDLITKMSILHLQLLNSLTLLGCLLFICGQFLFVSACMSGPD